MTDFDYVPEYGYPAEGAPYEGYPAEGAPQYGGYAGYEQAPSTGRHSAGQPDLPATRAYGVPQHMVDRRQIGRAHV